MSRFIQSTQHLRTIMQLLRDSSVRIRVEAFHVFKLFVANPKKPPEVTQILAMNRDKLLDFLDTLGESSEGDAPAGEQQGDSEQRTLLDEKRSIIAVIESLQPVPPP